MGKGKGSVVRYCARILQNHSLLEFIGFNLKDLIFLKKIFKKKINLPIKINFNFFSKTNTCFFLKNELFFTTKKYNN